MPLTIRSVAVTRSWDWILEGTTLFSKASAMWLLLIGTLFIGSRVLLLVPPLGVLAALITPNFLAGLMHGAQALDAGKPLRFGYLVSGFLRHGIALVKLGGFSLLMQLLILLVMATVGGAGVHNLLESAASGTITPEMVDAAAPGLTLAMLAGLALSVPMIMALWFAPLLVFFDQLKPLSALVLSLRACAKNFAPLLLYGIILIAPGLALMPLSATVGFPDLGLWLVSPLLIPSIYASYKDIFVPTPAIS